MNFNERVDAVIRERQSLLCVGLDSVIEKMPKKMQRTENPLFEFNKAIIDATLEHAAAFKLNLAFYEVYGAKGWEALKATLNYLPDDVICIADAKRGDIGNTAGRYAEAIFSELGADAVTVNPYMGRDSAEPFLTRPEKGVFFLCLTSNPGSADFQHFSDGSEKLYERVAKTVVSWNEHGNCGLVVGATHPPELAGVRNLAPELPFLIPGIGAQGGDAEQAVRNGANAHASMALFNSSRAILYASNGENFAGAAAQAAAETKMRLKA